MKLKRCAALALAFAVLSAPALAFDGKRKGFILGGGVGGAFQLVKAEPGFDQDMFSPTTNIKIGYGQSESLEVYYLNSCSIVEAGVNISNCLGVTKYLNREGKGVFLFGGVGIAYLFALSDSQTGFSVLGGVGYDIGRHWSIQGDVLYTKLDLGMDSIVSFRVSINFLAF
jgi:hypothetical protein